LSVNSDGVGKYTVRGSTPGEYPVRGTISVRNDRTGKVDSYPLPDFKYTVAAPFATVTPTKMNVFYIGVDNPVAVSAAGFRQQDLNVSMNNGTITSSGSGYIVRVQNQGETNVTVSAKGKQLASLPFRIKRIPDPIAKVGGKNGGTMPSAEMKVQQGLSAILENFDFDARFEVISYNVTYLPRKQDPATVSVTGPYFNAAVKQFQSTMKPGDTVYFEEIRVKGPDGTQRKITGIVFKLT
jgi:gliding motility-associated protein GldM